MHYAIILISLIFLGCEQKLQYASVDENLTFHSKDEKVLAYKAALYWDKRSQGLYKEIYTMELPYQKFVKSKENYLKFHSGNRKNYYVTITQINTINKSVAIVSRQTKIGDSTPYVTKEKWIKIDGKWYHKYRTSKLPGHTKYLL